MQDSYSVDQVIEAFGGITATAEAIGSPITTVSSWKQSGRIPRWRHREIVGAALQRSVSLPDDFLRAAQKVA